MDFHIPEKVNIIIEELNRQGFEAYAVGGCVRDMVLGREPEDWDITTSAKPLEVKKLFRRTVDTGIQHGTVTVLLDKEHFEVTTYRLDGIYEDNRHPKKALSICSGDLRI
jgi:tRNA nucleotidyltransferase (CCA-adding enzyme)